MNDSSTNNKKSNNLKLDFIQKININYVISIVLFIFVLIGIIYVIDGGEKLGSFAKTGTDYTDKWYDEENNEVDLGNIHKNKLYDNKKIFVIHKKIERKDVDKDGNISVCLRTQNCYIEGYVGDKKVFESDNNKHVWIKCKSPGCNWFFYRLRKSDIGKNIQLRIRFVYNDSSAAIEFMKLANERKYLLNYLHDYVLAVVMYFVILVIAVVFVVYGVILYKRKDSVYELFVSLGLMSGCFAVWLILATSILELFMINASTVQALSCVVLAMTPIPGIYVLKNNFELKNKSYCNKLALFAICVNIFIIFLHIFNIKDLHETLIICHLLILICSISMIVEIILEGRKKERKRKTINLKSIISFAIIMILFLGIIVDMYHFYKGELFVGLSFIQIDIMVVIIYCSIVAFKRMMKWNEDARHSEFISRLAYIDGLTGVNNRTSFIEKIDDIKNNPDKYKRIGLIVFDVNYLKKVNDIYGHPEGDSLLCATADILSKIFVENCQVYRIGGDEFAVIINASNVEMVYKVGVMQLKNKIQNYNNFYRKKYELSVAYGSAFYDSNGDKSIELVIKEADDNMYNKKAEIKKEKNIL